MNGNGELADKLLPFVRGLVIALALFKLVQFSFAGVFMDEAYYWMWGQHPALSYYDHPPLNAWLLGLSSALFGWNRFALRLPVALAFYADFVALALIARLMAADAWQRHFWPTALLFMATPVFWMVTSYALPDHILLTMCLFAIYFFARFFAARGAGSAGASRDLFLAALFTGLAGLAKYNAAFLPAGVALYVLFYDRRLLAEPRLYLALLLTGLLQLPTIVWNVSENFASWEFILHDRHSGLRASFDGMYPLLIGLFAFVSPFLFWPMLKLAIQKKNGVPGFARATFALSTISIIAIAFTTAVLFHWNLVAYAAAIPFLALYMRPRLLWALQVVYGVAIIGLVFVNYSVKPMTPLHAWRDEATAWSFGWAPVAEATAAFKAQYNPGFVAATDYTTASLLGFALKDRDVVSISDHTDAYDYWFDASAHRGQTALVYGDSWRPLQDWVRRKFGEIVELGSYATIVNGDQLDMRRLYLAKDFNPDG